MENEGMMFITGIEDTFVANQDAFSNRSLDEYELTGHYAQFEKDLQMIASVGFRDIRYGIPWYLVHPEPNRFDWSWVDRAMDALQQNNLDPIIDFIHYGTPLWMDNAFCNADFPAYMVEYVHAFLERYGKRVSMYTPMNEPFITQEFCGRKALWPPYLSGMDGFAKITLSTMRGVVQSVEMVKKEFPQLFALHVEASGLFLCADSALQPVVDRENELRFFNYDLLLGRVDETHPLFSTFRKAGWSNADFGWFRDHALAIDGFGVNYYPQLSVYRIQGDPSHPEFVGVYGGLEYLEKLLAQYQQRYGGPLFLTETSINGPVEHQVRWWKESTQFCQSLAQKGMDLRGYTWFPAMDLINWDYRTGNLPLERYREPMGFIQLSMDAGRQWARSLSPLAEEMKRKLLPSGKGERRR